MGLARSHRSRAVKPSEIVGVRISLHAGCPSLCRTNMSWMNCAHSEMCVCLCASVRRWSNVTTVHVLQIMPVAGTNIFLGIVNQSCEMNAFCPCSTVVSHLQRFTLFPFFFVILKYLFCFFFLGHTQQIYVVWRIVLISDFVLEVPSLKLLQIRSSPQGENFGTIGEAVLFLGDMSYVIPVSPAAASNCQNIASQMHHIEQALPATSNYTNLT